MNDPHFFIGLPLTPLFFGGGLFLLSMFLPTFLASYLKKQEAKRHE